MREDRRDVGGFLAPGMPSVHEHDRPAVVPPEEAVEVLRAGVLEHHVGIAVAAVNMQRDVVPFDDRHGQVEQVVADGLGVRAAVRPAGGPPALERAGRLGFRWLGDVKPGSVGDHRFEGDGAGVPGGLVELLLQGIGESVKVCQVLADEVVDERLNAGHPVHRDCDQPLEVGAADRHVGIALVGHQLNDLLIGEQPPGVANRVRPQDAVTRLSQDRGVLGAVQELA